MIPRKNTIPPTIVIWLCILVACAIAWSFQLSSFLDAKGLILSLGLVAAAGAQCYEGNLSHGLFRRFLPLWLGVAVWIFSGFLTAHVQSFHLEKSIYLALVLLAASLASDAFKRPGGRIWMVRGLVFSGVAVGALALLQYAGRIDFLLPPFPGYDQRAYSVFGNQNLLGGFMAVNLALLAALPVPQKKPARLDFIIGILAFSILLGALLVSGTRSAWLAAVVGCSWGITKNGFLHRPGHPFKRQYSRRLFFLMTVVFAILLLGAPIMARRITQTFSDRDVGGNSRIWFWAGAAHMVTARPILGVGLGNYAYWSPSYQGQALETFGANHLYHNELHTVHAHSEPLEFLAETGIIGLAFLLWFVVAALRRPRLETAGLLALGVFACFNTLSHSPPHLLTGLLLAGSCLSHGNASREPLAVKSHALIFAAATTLVIAYGYTQIAPSYLLNQAEQVHIAGGTPESLYLHALRWPWPNPQAHESYAVSLMDESRFEEAQIQLEQALERLDTGRVHLLLAICAEASGDKKNVLFHAHECLYRWPDNEHARSLTTVPIVDF